MDKTLASRSIVFTLCSNNYLAQAKTLMDSVMKYNPDTLAYIALTDVKSAAVDYSFLQPASVFEVNNEIVRGFDDMVARYNLIELNTAVKPFVFQYLIQQHPEIPAIYYFDPDIMLYNDLQCLHDLLVPHDIILTPHFYTPLPIDGLYPHESMALKYGVYNLGFLGLKTGSAEVSRFLTWWGERTFHYGYDNNAQGLFVDQLWITLVPLFFREVHVIQHPGCNMGPWNLHERWIESVSGHDHVMLNNGDRLIFYHYSSYNFHNPLVLPESYNRNDLNKLPFLKKLYESYHLLMISNKAEEFSGIKCALPVVTREPALKHRIMAPVIGWLRSVWKKI